MTATTDISAARVLAGLRPVPERHAVRDVDLATAARQLDCAPEVVADLVERGFPADRTADGPLFDLHDLANLGLRAGTGRSFSEQAESRMMRMSRGEPGSWCDERGWRVRLTAACAAGCAVTPPSPSPEELGGELVARTDDEPGRATVEVVTRGVVGEPRRTVVRAVFDDVLADLRAGRLQFGWLPHTLRARPDEAVAHRMLDCVVAAWLMADNARTAGLETRTRKGFVLGPVPVEHAWTEVREDGRWLPLDPVLAFLAGRHPGAHDGFADHCRGSGHNRLLGWAVPAEEPYRAHDCPDGRTAGLVCTVLATSRGGTR